MKKGEMLSKMLLLVTQRFDGKFDKAGNPYVLHLLKVMHYCKTDDEELQCIALGHDLVEDTPTTYAELNEFGFTARIIQGIKNMTKVPGETERDYLDRLMSAKDSIIVKLADLRHNSDIRRLKGLAEKDFARMQKYHRMYLILTEALANFTEPVAGPIVFMPVDGGTDVFDLDDWEGSCRVGAITASDGCGYWMKGAKLESDIDCFTARPEWATHVAWYNK